jgi:hypothetical protein
MASRAGGMLGSSPGVIDTWTITSAGDSWNPRQGYGDVEEDEIGENGWVGGGENARDCGDRGAGSGSISGLYQGPRAPLMAWSS